MKRGFTQVFILPSCFSYYFHFIYYFSTISNITLTKFSQSNALSYVLRYLTAPEACLLREQILREEILATCAAHRNGRCKLYKFLGHMI